MTPEDPSPRLRARVTDLLRPGRLYAGIEAHPGFVIPIFLFVACVMTYTQAAFGHALPRILPSLLESSQSTETELVRAFRLMILAVSFVAPGLFVFVTAIGAWLGVRATRARPAFILVLSLVAHASLWAGIGFLAKAALVVATRTPEPALNLGFFFRPEGDVEKVLSAFTNPFLILALVWTVRGLSAWGVGRVAAAFGGGVPWAAWIVGIALLSGGHGDRLAPAGPIEYGNWGTLEEPGLLMRFAPESRVQAEDAASIITGFTGQLGEQFDFTPRDLRVNMYRDHADLERATGEFLHVRVTGSIRGRDLLYMETPGRSTALPQDAGLHDAVRYVALMQLAPVAQGAPRWFVEGAAHAIAIPHSPRLEREYRSVLERTGLPTYETLLDPRIFRTPEGPVLARSLVDFIGFHHGQGSVDGILRDVIGGTPFRDALYARTRLTASALETGWQGSIVSLLASGADEAAPGSDGEGEDAPAPEDEAAADGTDDGEEADMRAFQSRH